MNASKIRVGMCLDSGERDEAGQPVLEMVSHREVVRNNGREFFRLYTFGRPGQAATYTVVEAGQDLPVFNVSGEEL